MSAKYRNQIYQPERDYYCDVYLENIFGFFEGDNKIPEGYDINQAQEIVPDEKDKSYPVFIGDFENEREVKIYLKRLCKHQRRYFREKIEEKDSETILRLIKKKYVVPSGCVHWAATDHQDEILENLFEGGYHPDEDGYDSDGWNITNHMSIDEEAQPNKRRKVIKTTKILVKYGSDPYNVDHDSGDCFMDKLTGEEKKEFENLCVCLKPAKR